MILVCCKCINITAENIIVYCLYGDRVTNIYFRIRLVLISNNACQMKMCNKTGFNKNQYTIKYIK